MIASTFFHVDTIAQTANERFIQKLDQKAQTGERGCVSLLSISFAKDLASIL